MITQLLFTLSHLNHHLKSNQSTFEGGGCRDFQNYLGQIYGEKKI